MAQLLENLIDNAKGYITFAATGGLKAQTMIMALVGNQLGIPVCYIHEQYKFLLYLPYLQESTQQRIIRANLPDSGRDRSDVIQVQTRKAHHRPLTWPKVEKLLEDTPWVDLIRYDSRA
ncbi:putative CRISPR-associated protein [Synechococcus sp. Nb3U1]|uniref:putative CRISPR-associated protein n=1 Tax=Synechococcus sp. Nb3U1 TaxID=1914529 RepID=UPI001F20946F|nr:putative CRISPR-associated protein [Synechococcus sp. Nb3U1]MCF2971757.1 putative CRISPR-associated protein [Synechococcus sp. Nb3U1]